MPYPNEHSRTPCDLLFEFPDASLHLSDQSMSSCSDHLKILWSVICLYTIQMMNKLILSKRSSKFFSHDETMFKDGSSAISHRCKPMVGRDCNQDISSRRKIFSPLPLWVILSKSVKMTRLATTRMIGQFGITDIHKSFLFAVRADNPGSIASVARRIFVSFPFFMPYVCSSHCCFAYGIGVK